MPLGFRGAAADVENAPAGIAAKPSAMLSGGAGPRANTANGAADSESPSECNQQ